MFRKILIFICCVLLSFSAKAQQTFLPFLMEPISRMSR